VIFKWQFCYWTGNYPAENHHMTGQRVYYCNDLLFVISKAQTGHPAVFTDGKICYFAASHPTTM